MGASKCCNECYRTILARFYHINSWKSSTRGVTNFTGFVKETLALQAQYTFRIVLANAPCDILKVFESPRTGVTKLTASVQVSDVFKITILKT